MQGSERVSLVDQNLHLVAASQAIYNQAMQQQLQQHHDAAQQHQQQQHQLHADINLSSRSTFVTHPPAFPEGPPVFQGPPSSDLQTRERHDLAASSGLFMPSHVSASFASNPFDSFPRPDISSNQTRSHPTFSANAALQPKLNPEAATSVVYEALSSGTLDDYDMLVLAHAAGLIDDHGDLLPTANYKQGTRQQDPALSTPILMGQTYQSLAAQYTGVYPIHQQYASLQQKQSAGGTLASEQRLQDIYYSAAHAPGTTFPPLSTHPNLYHTNIATSTPIQPENLAACLQGYGSSNPTGILYSPRNYPSLAQPQFHTQSLHRPTASFPASIPPPPLNTAAFAGLDAAQREAQNVDRLTTNMALLFTQPRPLESAQSRGGAPAQEGGGLGRANASLSSRGIGMGLGVGMRSLNIQQQFAASVSQESGSNAFPSMPSGSGPNLGYGPVRGRGGGRGGPGVTQDAGIDAGMAGLTAVLGLSGGVASGNMNQTVHRAALPVMPESPSVGLGGLNQAAQSVPPALMLGTSGGRGGGTNQAKHSVPPPVMLGSSSAGGGGPQQDLRSLPQAGSSSRQDPAMPKLGNMLPCYQHSLYKTELCRSWEEHKTCRYTFKCQFAHGIGELVAAPTHGKDKSEASRVASAAGSSFSSRVNSAQNAAARILSRSQGRAISLDEPAQVSQAMSDQTASETARRSLDALMTQQRQQQTAYNLQILRGLLSNAYPSPLPPHPPPHPFQQQQQQPSFPVLGPHPPPLPPPGAPNPSFASTHNPNYPSASNALPDSYAEYAAWLQQSR